MRESAVFWLALKSTKGLGERTLKKLFLEFGSGRSILSAERELLERIAGRRVADAVRVADPEKAQRTLEACRREGIDVVTIEDEDYPQELRDIPDPPPVLFVRGSWKDAPLVAIVGTRKPTSYTLSLTEETVKLLVESGYGIVSGGARGVDSASHLFTVKYKGYTVCVLGMGILRCRGSVFETILKKGGALISEFMPEERAERYTFAKRNRIIAGLARKVIIPEAGRNSGSLITANYAVSYRKEVYVHIGMGRSPKWEGCYLLIKEGKAQLFMDPSEVVDGKVVKRASSLEEFLREPRTFDEIAEFLNMPHDKVNSLLLDLELRGKIRRIGSHFIAL